jgi:hypothetical protein
LGVDSRRYLPSVPGVTAHNQGWLGLPCPDAPDARLQVSVIFTSEDATKSALNTAAALAARLGAHIKLIVPQVVPFPVPLASPNVLVGWNERRLRQIATECPVETSVQVLLCRDRVQTLLGALKPNSLVVLGGCKRRIWRNAEARLARKLRHSGHEVVTP